MPEKTVEHQKERRRRMSCRNRSVHPWPSARVGPRTLQTWRNIRLIIGREYKNQVTQRIFIIMSIILLVIVFLAAFIPTIVQFVTAGSAIPIRKPSIVMVNEAGPIAGLNGATLTSYIGSELNGTNPPEALLPMRFLVNPQLP